MVESLQYHVNRSAECDVGKRPCQKPTSPPSLSFRLDWSTLQVSTRSMAWALMSAMSTRRSSAHLGLSVEKIEGLVQSPRKVAEEGCTCRNSNLGRHCPHEGPYGRLHFVSVGVGRVAETFLSSSRVAGSPQFLPSL